MNRRRGKGGGGGGDKRPPVKALPGARAAIERAWLNAVLSGSDPQRIAQLERMLTPAANDTFEATLVWDDGPLPPPDLFDDEVPSKQS